jgi:3-deoxy-manno-octulosonate cytidylyltransferase (CMP-KDO synthetase)
VSFRVVIPARYASVRLPGKPLVNICGQPMLYWVHQIATQSGAAEVVIATDDERILTAAESFGARVQMTSPTHASGTDRIAEVALARGWKDGDIVVNLQGDEPLMPPALLQQVAELLSQHAHASIATLATRIGSVDAFKDVNCVKVVTDQAGRALYFSRAPIPWGRDTAPAGLASQRGYTGARRHIGIYAYRIGALRRLSLLPPSPLERLEKLEQLRALENGMEIRVGDAKLLPGPAVDTEQDLALVNSLKAQQEKGR